AVFPSSRLPCAPPISLPASASVPSSSPASLPVLSPLPFVSDASSVPEELLHAARRPMGNHKVSLEAFMMSSVVLEVFASNEADRSEEHTSELQSRGNL